ncbi:hypothetical protein PLICRDRAFT_179327 [Plicaturopsis crispa FD-325 SS-3]|uniref:Uncharacterized protein n=1 Tax=Plicaturopsis crispa FD-325 SS-3 TaxID=944288 RepID=A0A0C9SXN7_PLICR|nr:hypothetical protein PLICRDRAFT_179327 [Plicaturopsis crispa FD-325 SS-3]
MLIVLFKLRGHPYNITLQDSISQRSFFHLNHRHPPVATRTINIPTPRSYSSLCLQRVLPKKRRPNVLPVAFGSFANSLILSSDPRASRHRSGVMSQDSATLPPGESPMLNSPYWCERRVFTSSMVMTPDTGRTSPIPPIPPMPGFVKGASASGNAATLARRRSTSAASLLQEEMGAGLVRSASTHSRLEVGEHQASRRISRISEAPSPAPSVPSMPQRTSFSGRSINGEQSSIVSPSLRRTSPSPTFEVEQEQHMQSTGADRDSASTEGVEREHTVDRESTTPVQEQLEVPEGPLSGTGSVAISEGPLSDDSGTDIRNLLQNYQFQSNTDKAKLEENPEWVIPPTGPSVQVDSIGGNCTASRVLGAPALLACSSLPPFGAATSEPKITSSTICMSSISQLAGSVLHNSATSVKSLRPSTAPRTDPLTPTSPNILDGMLAPATRGIFVCQHSGSTPNPITVVRDAKMRTYSIAVSESPMSSSATSPPTSWTQQTFPETPDAFSPMWSAGPGQTMPAESSEPEPAPPSLRPNSGPTASSRIMLGPRTNLTSTAPGTKESTLSPIGENGESTAVSNDTLQYPLSAFMADYEHSPPVPLAIMKDLPNVPPPTPPAFVQSKETSEGRPITAPTRRSPDIEVDTVQANVRKPSGPSELAPPASTALSAPLMSTSFVPPPAPPPLPSAPPPSRSPPPPPRARSPQPSLAPSPASFSPSYVAPPPYQAAVSSAPSQPTTADTPVQASNGPVKLGQGLSASSLGSISGSSHRPRTRPPLPIGPRKPSATGPSILVDGRARNGSVSSMASIRTCNESGEMSAGTWRTFSAGMTGPSPKFQTQPIKWRGYTMDAAIWTFTSHQLQSIVSRAIKQSAEASSIRLLRLESLDNEAPEELHRLDMLRMDIRTRYKAMTRKRWSLIGSLSALVDGEQPGDPASACPQTRLAYEMLV